MPTHAVEATNEYRMSDREFIVPVTSPKPPEPVVTTLPDGRIETRLHDRTITVRYDGARELARTTVLNAVPGGVIVSTTPSRPRPR